MTSHQPSDEAGVCQLPQHTLLTRAGDALAMLYAFACARYRRPNDQATLNARQSKSLRNLLDSRLPSFEFYRESLARLPSEVSAHQRLRALPVVDKRTMLNRFSQFNQPGWSLDHAREMAQNQDTAQASTSPYWAAGLSSGTTGPASVFITSPRERARWAGTVLARALSEESLQQVITPWRSPLRVALLLRANDNLYERVGSARLRFEFVDMAVPIKTQIAELEHIDPQVLVAPPSVLSALARAALNGRLAITPQQVISAAEVLEPDDTQTITAAWGVNITQLYQCTEGLLGSSCEHGRLHLHEEYVLIEPEWLDADRFTPIITDLSRETQAFVRYRLDDVLRIDRRPCPCGRCTVVIAAIEGRMDDVLQLPDAGGKLHRVFPDSLRRAMAELDLHPLTLDDWRLQQAANSWTFSLKHTYDIAGERVMRSVVNTAVLALCKQLGLDPPLIRFVAWQDRPATTKRRRIQRLALPEEALSA